MISEAAATMRIDSNMNTLRCVSGLNLLKNVTKRFVMKLDLDPTEIEIETDQVREI